MPQSNEVEGSPTAAENQATESTHHAAMEGNAPEANQQGSTQKQDGRRRDNLTAEQRSAIGRKGGEAVSRNREHMAEIGRKGGVAVSRDREHMANIGQKGGRS
ncbi:MAG TPA: hypothetical protein VIM69_00085 [Opitutaceae bacterium]